jgi:hypothetical protein
MERNKSFDAEYYVEGKWDETSYTIEKFEGSGNSVKDTKILPMELTYEKRNFKRGLTKKVEVYDIWR